MDRRIGPPPLSMKKMQDRDGMEWFKAGPHGYMIAVSTDDGALHMSISHQERYPHWDDIMAVWRWLAGPDLEGVIVLPRESDYVDLHPFCFHAWESLCQKEGR